LNKVAFSRPFFGIEEERAAADVIRSGWVVGGPRLAEFEKRFAACCNAEHAVGVSSWTTGAFLVLKTLGIGAGDEVIVPSLTFIASVNVIVHVGAMPVFVDIDPLTYNLDPDDVASKINPRTRAILPIDQVGMPCEIDRILELADDHKLIVIQDAACGFGAKFRDKPVGADAPVSVFSLHARKVITTGEGGMIVTNDGVIATKIRRLRHQGMSLSDVERHGLSPTVFESYPEIGYNFRITDIQAAIGLCQLDRLEDILARRRKVALRYITGLSQHPYLATPFVPEYANPNWQSFQIRVSEKGPLSRNALMEALDKKGIVTRRGVMASHLERPYRCYKALLPQTERAATECMQLPMHAGMSEVEVDTVLSAIEAIYRHL
jgi:perosamine synthetase